MYYDLLPFPRIANQIAKELEKASASSQNENHEVEVNSLIQLGLCHIAGFGVEKSNSKALEYFVAAARRGSHKAQALLPSLFEAFDIPVDDDLKVQFEDWQVRTSSMGSRVASRYLESVKGVHDLPDCILYSTPQPQDEPSLIHAVACGNFKAVNTILKQGVSSMSQGRQGETPLHRAVLLPTNLGIWIGKALLSYGADPFDARRRPWKPVNLSQHDFLFNEMPKGTSAFEWAIIEDNLPIVTIMIQATKKPKIAYNYLHLACQYLSVESLKFLLGQISAHDRRIEAAHRFKSDYSLLYQVLRPDLFDRLLRHSSVDALGNRSRIVSTRQRQQDVLRVLNEVDRNADMNSERSFSAIHLLSAFGEPDTLDSLLQDNTFRNLINEPTGITYGAVKPLREAIIRGRVDCFRILLRHGAEYSNLDHGNHAIYICAQTRERHVREMTRDLFSKDSQCLVRKNRRFCLVEGQKNNGYELLEAQRKALSGLKLLVDGTALHWAAYYNNTDLVKFCLSSGSNLLQLDASGHTALGLAVASRSIRTVRLLRREHLRRGLPLQARSVPYRLLRSSSAVKFVLKSSRLWDKVQQGESLSNAPYPRSPQLLVKILMRDYRPTIRLRTNVVYRCFHSSCFEAGADRAVFDGNYEATREILECKSVDTTPGTLRLLIACSIYRLSIAIREDKADWVNKREVLWYLLRRYEETHSQVRYDRRPQRPGLSGNFTTEFTETSKKPSIHNVEHGNWIIPSKGTNGTWSLKTRRVFSTFPALSYLGSFWSPCSARMEAPLRILI